MTLHLALDAAFARTPPDWERRRFRHVARPRNSRNVLCDQPLLSVSATHGVRERDEGGLGRQAPAEESISTYWRVYPGDIVVNPMWLVEGGVATSTLAGAVSPAYRVYEPNRDIADPHYLHYLLRSRPYIEQYRQFIRGLTTFDRAVSREDFEDVPLALPPLAEQRRIADFLDAETARIEKAASVRAEQISLLSELLQNEVSATAAELAATHGWIRVRHVLRKIEQGWSPQCEDRTVEPGEWGVVKSGCVNGGVFREDQHKALPAGVAPRLEYQLRKGDLLMSRASGSVDLIGSIAMVPEINTKLLLCDKIYRLTVDHTLMRPSYVAHMLRTHSVREHIKLRISGAEGMANNLPITVVKDCLVPKAPLSKQDKVVDRLEKRQGIIGRLREAGEAQISLLTERKQALITAAVSGQFDVTTARGADLS